MTTELRDARDLARLVRSVRLQQHLSQGALAERIGITRQAVANLESGRTIPSIATALAALRALDMRLYATSPAAHVRELPQAAPRVDDAASTPASRGPIDLDALLADVDDC